MLAERDEAYLDLLGVPETAQDASGSGTAPGESPRNRQIRLPQFGRAVGAAGAAGDPPSYCGPQGL
jgi:hypothetical protein